jgi:ornithine cyclodeaminase/alanine dehydrogenase-like protein (mu-crystallin family)
MALYLSEADIAGLLTMSDTVAALEDMLLARARGEVVNRPRIRVPIVGGTYNHMAAGWLTRDVVGHKTYTASPKGAFFHIALYAADGSGLIASMAGGTLSGLRTGAMTGLAARQFTTRPDGPIAVIGTGFQAAAQISGLRTTLPDAEIRVFSRSAEHREAFAARMTGVAPGTCRPVDSMEAALDGASVAVTITNSADPVLRVEHLTDGLTVVAVGNNTSTKTEIDPAAVGRADLVVVDDLDNAKLECGELIRAAEAGVFDWNAAVELHDVIGGTVPGRTSADQVVLVELQGIAAADVAVAELVNRRARAQGVGLEMPT